MISADMGKLHTNTHHAYGHPFRNGAHDNFYHWDGYGKDHWSNRLQGDYDTYSVLRKQASHKPSYIPLPCGASCGGRDRAPTMLGHLNLLKIHPKGQSL